jgi:hypothetical protein
VKDDITIPNFDWLAHEAIGDSQAGSQKLEIYCGKSRTSSGSFLNTVMTALKKMNIAKERW